jgi:hypothetical protein
MQQCTKDADNAESPCDFRVDSLVISLHEFQLPRVDDFDVKGTTVSLSDSGEKVNRWSRQLPDMHKYTNAFTQLLGLGFAPKKARL